MITRKTVVDFAEVMKAYGLTKLELKDDEKYILLETGRVSSPEANEDRLFTKDEEFESVKEEAPEKEPETKGGYVQKSIVVGTIYLSPAEGMDTFVKVGDKVSEGDVLSMVESMKMFNEINAEVSGTIKEILVSNGQTIEFGQPLFVIDTDEEEA
ncbi:MAG: biotin/lipoyl-binding protein [Firmicutes bacterium]|nr:biotin/lipoyl-binding protein [Bacillota bacterium]